MAWTHGNRKLRSCGIHIIYQYFLPFAVGCSKNVSVQGHFQELQWKNNGLKLQFLYKRGLAENFRERTYYTRQNSALWSSRFLKKRASKQKCLLVFFCANFSRLPGCLHFLFINWKMVILLQKMSTRIGKKCLTGSKKVLMWI